MKIADRWETCFECGHVKTWLARDGWLKCLTCGRKIKKYVRDPKKEEDGAP